MMISVAISETDLKKATGLPKVYCRGFSTLCGTASEPIYRCFFLLKIFFEGNALWSSLYEVG